MTSGSRLPTWKERENNRHRERRRRAIAAKIYTGLRMHGNYKLPKHCDNNEVLKALCDEAGWVVEEDGLTYKKGTRPPQRTPETGFAPYPFMSPASSSQPSPASSACPSPIRTSYEVAVPGDGSCLVPWLKGLSSARVLRYGGSYSAPVTPPLTSPICRSPKTRDGGKSSDWDALAAKSRDMAKDSGPTDCAATALLNAWSNTTCMVASCPPTPMLQAMSHEKRYGDVDVMEGEKALLPKAVVFSSTCSPSGMASPTPMGMWVATWEGSSPMSSSREKSLTPMWRPGYSYVSPAASVCTGGGTGDLKEVLSEPSPPLKAWGGEKIHDECPDVTPEDLELKL